MIYQKERPYRFNDFVGQDVTVNNIRNQSINNSWFQVYILHGQFGSGKTSMAWTIALSANCLNKDNEGNPCLKCENCRSIFEGNSDFKEIDGASNTGIDNIRELKEYITFLPSSLKYKVIIIDEVHMLSNAAFNSLLKMLEEPPEYVIFIMCTTHHSAIPRTIDSRSAAYTFATIDYSLIVDHIIAVAKKYDINLTEDAAAVIAKYSDGSMRNALKLLDQLSVSGKQITLGLCNEVMGLTSEDLLFKLFDALINENLETVIELSEEINKKGANFTIIGRDILDLSVDLLAAACGSSAITGSNSYVTKINEIKSLYNLQHLTSIVDLIKNLYFELRNQPTKNQFIVQGVTLIESLGIRKIQSIKVDVDALSEMEQEINILKESVRKLEVVIKHSAIEPIKKSKIDEVHVGDIESDNKNVSRQEIIETENEDSFDDIFDDDFLSSIMENISGSRKNQNSTKEIQKQEIDFAIAKEAEKGIQKLLETDPEVAPHINCGVIKEYTKEGLVLTSPEKSVVNLITLFIGKNSIKNVIVKHKPDI